MGGQADEIGGGGVGALMLLLLLLVLHAAWVHRVLRLKYI